MNFNQIFENALTYDEYVHLLNDHLSLHELHYKKFSVSEKDQRIIAGYRACKILIITETWCGDSLALIPIIRKISEINGQWEIKVILRDSNLDIIDQFLSRGVRGIPKFLFLDEQNNLLFHWGPRPEAAIEIFENFRDQINQGQIEKKEVIKKIRVYYAKDRGNTTLAELMEVFEENRL